MPGTTLRSKVLCMELALWRDFHFIQQDDFKSISAEAMEKLKNSLKANEFTQPFYAWKDPETGIIYCLDGKHRILALQEMVAEGLYVPDLLPATFIDCTNKQDAAKHVLIFSSMYARVQEAGMLDLLKLYEIEWPEISDQISIPEFKMHTEPIGDFQDEGIGVKNQYGVIIICKDEVHQEKVFQWLSGLDYECKVVVT